jgi:hypothetical protein
MSFPAHIPSLSKCAPRSPASSHIKYSSVLIVRVGSHRSILDLLLGPMPNEIV